jgi:photosystem II stability/assembly factor-like uncharacterized protein
MNADLWKTDWRRRAWLILLALLSMTGPSILRVPLIHAQDQTSGPWVMQTTTDTKAGLRGIHAVGGGVAWASGTEGTVLRTEDSGFMWQSCALPPRAEKLDFRGIWAWDENTAVVMSSGTGELSRIYKTTDGCSHWTLLYTNPDKDGFWDALVFSDRKNGFLLGDPVNGRFTLLRTEDGGATWKRIDSPDLGTSGQKLGAFAASNSAMVLTGPVLGSVWAPWFGTSGPPDPLVYRGGIDCTMGMAHSDPEACLSRWDFQHSKLPIVGANASSGVFSLALRGQLAVAIGGDYQKPNESAGTAAWSADGGEHWTAAVKPPHGYRSAVAWDADAKAWIAAGPNGSDISYDDGKTWQPLDNGKWNALSLPWIVGPEGRIAKLGSLPARK